MSVYIVALDHPDVLYEIALGCVQGEQHRAAPESVVSIASSNSAVVAVKPDKNNVLNGTLSFGKKEGVAVVTVTLTSNKNLLSAFSTTFVVVDDPPSVGGVLAVRGLEPQARIISTEPVLV